MKKAGLRDQNFVFATSVKDSIVHEEFSVELFDYSSELNCDGRPSRVLNSFDDLIHFIEELDM